MKCSSIANLKTWAVLIPRGSFSHQFSVEARTKSEALARAKSIFGLGAKDRLPIGTVVKSG